MLTTMFDDASERGYAITPAGMAYWSDTGPVGKLCRNCWFYKQRRCLKYKLLTGCKGKRFPAGTPSCKYFECAEE